MGDHQLSYRQLDDRAQLVALTLVMKGESIPEKSSWHGCPAAPTRF